MGTIKIQNLGFRYDSMLVLRQLLLVNKILEF